MADSSLERMRGKQVVKPIVYGNLAEPLSHKREGDGHTHKWTVFLRPYYNEDAGRWIRKVQFRLHESFENAVRVVERPPYEVTETGWGEFEVSIKVFFADPNEKPVTAYHYLRLYQPVVHNASGKPTVISEFYDELVFQEPSALLYSHLTGGQGEGKRRNKQHYNDFEQQRRRLVELGAAAKVELSREIEDLKDALALAHKLLQQHREAATATTSAANSQPASPLSACP